MSDIDNTPMDDFDFFLSLTDDNDNAFSKETRKALENEKANRVPDEVITNESWEAEPIEDYEAPDWESMLDDKNNIQFEDDEDTEESDDIDDSPTTESDDVEDYDYEPEAYDVDLDTIITLPDGKELTIEELSNGYLEGDKLTNREKEIVERETQLNQRYEAAKNLLDVANLETDKLIADYNAFDWDALDPYEYREHKRYLEALHDRKNKLVKEFTRLESDKQAQEEEAFRAKSRACVEVLKHEIPNWGDALYGQLMDYAIQDLGADEEAVLKWNDPSIFKMLHKSMQFDKGVEKAKAKLRGRNVSKTHLSAGKPSGANPNADRDILAKKYAQGQMSQEEAFKFLED